MVRKQIDDDFTHHVDNMGRIIRQLKALMEFQSLAANKHNPYIECLEDYTSVLEDKTEDLEEIFRKIQKIAYSRSR